MQNLLEYSKIHKSNYPNKPEKTEAYAATEQPPIPSLRNHAI